MCSVSQVLSRIKLNKIESSRIQRRVNVLHLPGSNRIKENTEDREQWPSPRIHCSVQTVMDTAEEER